MSITFSCGGCGKQYSVKEEFGGKKTRCKKCNAVIAIPMSASEADLDPPDIGFLDEVAVPRRGEASAQPVASSQPVYRGSSSSAAPVLAGRRMPLKPSEATESFTAQARKVTTIHDARIGTSAGAHAARAAKPARAAMTGDRDPALERDAARASIGFVILVFLLAIAATFASGNADEVGAWVFAIVMALIVVVAFFALATPATMGGVWITCKMFGQGVPSRLYIRSAGAVLTSYFLSALVGVGAGVLTGLASAAGAPVVAIPVSLLALLLNIYIWFYVYSKYFDLGVGGTIVASLMSCILVAICFLPLVLIAMSLQP